ncbi:MAG: CO dehydrogenase/acetyl-CoA synthase complex subunit epsilon [Candidatus Ranarchaeia archaeon]
MSSPKPWRKAEIAQPISGSAIKEPATILRVLDKAKRPILIVGHRTAYPDNEDTPYLDYVIQIANLRDIPVVATAHTIKAFITNNYRVASWLSAMDIINRIRDPTWQGLDGKGAYDLVLMTGLPYEMTSLLLNTLKHFTKIKTICLDRFYFPNASLAYPNLREKRWFKELDALIEALKTDKDKKNASNDSGKNVTKKASYEEPVKPKKKKNRKS